MLRIADMPGERGKYSSQYTPDDLRCAVQRVLQEGWSTNHASKQDNVPFNTLKRYLMSSSEPNDVSVAKKGRPLVLTVGEEQTLVTYVIKMQEIGFGLSATDVRRQAFELIKKSGRKNPFNEVEELAGWDWWTSFKERYGLVMRLPENLSVNRSASVTKEAIDEFYDVLGATLEKHDLEDRPNRIWNLDESGFSYVNKPGKIVSPKGRKHVYQQTAAERGETTTVLLAVNAAGQTGPCLTIFKGQRLSDDLKLNAPANSLVCVSPNGWMNSEIFLQFMRHFEENIPPARPVLIILDSHCSHLSVDVMKFREEKNIIFLTFPSHTTHILQPLDVSVFGPMKAAWKKSVKAFLVKEGRKPTRKDVFRIFTGVFLEAANMMNITKGFKHTGIFPFDKNAISKDVYCPSEIHSESVPDLQDNIATIPLPRPFRRVQQRKSAAKKARVFDTVEERTSEEQHNQAAPVEVVLPVDLGLQPTPVFQPTRTQRRAGLREGSQAIPSTSGVAQKNKNNDICQSCQGSFVNDKNGESWIQCVKCYSWYHEICQGLKRYRRNFECLGCIDDSD